jgi:voltage-gated potassium channel
MVLKIPTSLKELRFLQLTLYTIFFLIISPVLSHSWPLSILTELFLLNALLVSLSAGGRQVRLKWSLWCLWGAGLVCFLLGDFGVIPALTSLFQVLDIIFNSLLLLVCIFVILALIFQSQRVTIDTIFAALMNYMLIAFIYAQFYQFLLILDPRSFKLPASLFPDAFRIFHIDLLYFSMVTITTVGFGDIVAQTGVARMAAAVEAMIGPFYIAILVAWLVGMFISQSISASQQKVDQNRH